MPPVVAFAGQPEQRAAYRRHLEEAAAEAGLELDLHMDPAQVDPARVDYLVFSACGVVTDFAPFTRLRAILNLWAGVEAALRLGPPPEVPLVRMAEEGLTLGMIDYVSGHVLRHHLDIDRYIGAAPFAEWETDYPPLARDRTVAVLGLGVLGEACARALAGHGFRVIGWARSPKEIAGVACRHGAGALPEVLAEAEILVLLLPHTAGTERIMDAEALARLPEGACIVNAGRGPLIDHDALLAALDAGRVRHATMDVFDVEPLPPEHPYWRHPRVTVTPHIASVTRPETAARAILANIRRDLAGEPVGPVVQRERGY
jgi:glyoxylate/hydroxypyruvate reductase A